MARRERKTYSPVGCSYLPVWGVSSCSERDMIALVCVEMYILLLREKVKRRE